MFSFKLKNVSSLKEDGMFLNSFPFGDIVLGYVYENIVTDKVNDSSISVEKELIKNQGGTLTLRIIT